MLKNLITPEDIERTEKKLREFEPSGTNLGLMKADPSLFAYFAFRDSRTGGPFKVLPYQDMILNDQSKRILLSIARQSGKSTIAAIKAIHLAFFNDNYTVVVVSRTKEQSLELVRRIKVLMKGSDIPWNAIFPSSKEGKTEIQLKNHKKPTYSRIISVPATDAARGYSPDFVISDEVAFWENGEYIFNQVVEPMTTFTKGTIWMLSTPNGKQGVFWNAYNSPYWTKYQFGWKVNPNNTQEEMDVKASLMTRMEFQSEYEAQFMSSQNAYFSPVDIKACCDATLIMGHIAGEENIVVGVDFGKINDNAVIYVGKVEDSSLPPNEQIIRILDRRVKPLGTNYDAIIGELKVMNELYRPMLFVLDATGVGEGPSDVLKAYGCFVEPIKFSMQKKANLFSNLKIFLEQRRIKLPDILELRNQLELFEYKYTLAGNIILSAPEGYHDDECCALALMVWGLSRVLSPPVSGSFIPYGKSQEENEVEERCKHPQKRHDEQGELFCVTCDEQL